MVRDRGRSGVNRKLLRIVDAARAYVEREAPGWSLSITSGYRSQAAQARLVARWNRGSRSGLTSRPAASSAHSRGLAVDLAFAFRGRSVPVSATPRAAFAQLAALMAPYGVRWGGEWASPSPNHFELG